MKCFFAGLAIVALQLTGVKASSICITEHCITHVASTSVKHVPTYTRSVTYYDVRTRTVTLPPIIHTVTHSVVTRTVTSTCTSHIKVTSKGVAKTDTFTSTLTKTKTNVKTDTTSTTIEAGSTVTITSTSTTTVPTVAGFTPVASEALVIINGGGSDAKRRRRHQYRDAVKKKAVVEAALEVRGGGNPKDPDCGPFGLYSHGKCQRKAYPHDVACTKTVDVINYTTRTAKRGTKTVTTTPTKTKTATITRTSTATVVIPPKHVSSTVFISTTITSTSTTTTTITITDAATTTVTTFAPDATVYAQCQSDNIIDRVGTVYIGGAEVYQLAVTPDNGALACCVSCATTPDCAGFVLGQGQCLLEDHGVGGDDPCDPSASYYGIFGNATTPMFTVGNGQCGQSQYVRIE
jgi:hypothetical protein